jgi:hypothetical protein
MVMVAFPVPIPLAAIRFASNLLLFRKGGVRMVVIRFLSWMMLFLGIYYIAVAVVFCFPQNRAATLGNLVKTKHRRNVRLRDPVSKKEFVASHSTRFVYSYTVGPKTYHLSGSALRSPKQLPYRPRIVYMKMIPRYAFVSGLTMLQRPWWGAFLIFISLLFLTIT